VRTRSRVGVNEKFLYIKVLIRVKRILVLEDKNQGMGKKCKSDNR
jgi:hypothetical protein